MAQLYREARDGDMLKDFLGEPDDIALVALGPIVVTGYRLQELDPAEGTGDHQIGHHSSRHLLPPPIRLFILAPITAKDNYRLGALSVLRAFAGTVHFALLTRQGLFDRYKCCTVARF